MKIYKFKEDSYDGLYVDGKAFEFVNISNKPITVLSMYKELIDILKPKTKLLSNSYLSKILGEYEEKEINPYFTIRTLFATIFPIIEKNKYYSTTKYIKRFLPNVVVNIGFCTDVNYQNNFEKAFLTYMPKIGQSKNFKWKYLQDIDGGEDDDES